ncbi:hypothetical protein DFJ74DRAFT_630398 [Hyaloraphidium curvatum]|nr:hypothetical protein DFJ74DRAFT_630398 [Hyaloraphidium curvatum]
MVVFRGPLIPIPRVSVQDYLFRDGDADKLEKRSLPIVEDSITGEVLTFGDFADAAEDLASEWMLLGGPWTVNRGDVVALISPNHVDYFRAFFAIIRCGGVVSTMNHLYREFEFKHTISLVNAKYLIVHSQVLDTVMAVAKELGIDKSRVAVFDDIILGGTIAPRTGLAKELPSLREMMQSGRRKATKAPWISLREDEVDKTLLWVPFSSGTTGLSKGVALSHYNLVAQAEQRIFVDADEFVPGRFVSLSATPPAHIGGGTFMCTYLKSKVKSVLLPRFEIEPVLKAVEKYKVSFLPVLPPVAVNILALGGKDYLSKFDLRSIRFLSCATATLPASTEDAITKAFGVRMRQMYGMSECTCVTHCTRRESRIRSRPDSPLSLLVHYKRGPDVKGSNGPPVPCLDCKLVDPKTGKECGVGEEGEVLLKGPTVFMGYLGNDKATAEAILEDADGKWYRTGDIGVCDELGFLTITDRIKEMFKVNGYQVSPAELEALLIQHRAVAEAAVIGIPDPVSGDIPKAFVVLKPGVQGTQELVKDITDFVAPKVAPYKRLRGGIEFVDELVKVIVRMGRSQLFNNVKYIEWHDRNTLHDSFAG